MVRSWPEEQPLPAAEADAAISWDGFVPERLDRALFVATNELRVAHGLAPLRALGGLAGAAQLQAVTNAFTGTARHDNPLSGQSDVYARVRSQGIRPQAVWENVAAAVVRVAPSGGDVQLRIDDAGNREFVDSRTKAPLPWPSYRQLADRLLDQWLHSPPHRKNLLNPSAQRLACGSALVRGPVGEELVHAVQVFVSLPPSP